MRHHITNYYYSEKVLGEGGFGLVKQCVEKSTGQKFAVKIIEKRSARELQVAVIFVTIKSPTFIYISLSQIETI